MCFPTVFTVIYLTSVFASTDAQSAKPTLTRTPKFDVLYRGESVTFTCGVDLSSKWNFLWFHNGTEITGSTSTSTYTIAAIDHPSSGEYLCRASESVEPFSTEQSDPLTLQVFDLTPPVLKLESQWPDVFEDESVELFCDADTGIFDLTFTWYRNKEQLQDDSVVVLDQMEPTLNITAIGRAHQGGYACQIHLESRTVKSELSNTVNITVYEILVPSLRNLTWTDVFHGEKVEMSCGMNDGLAWTYTWYKDGQEVHADQVVSFDTNKATLSISSASAAFKGEYKCRGHLNNRPVGTNFSSGVILSVYDEMPKVTLTQDPEYKVIFVGESVVFSCHVSASTGWEYMWTKDSSLLSHTENKLTISPQESSDQGSYECQAKRGTNRLFPEAKSEVVNIKVEESKPKPLVTQQPDAEKVYIGESLSFKCEIKDSAGWEYSWFKDGKQITVSGSKFDIPQARLADSGTYECMGTRNISKYGSLRSDRRVINISEIPSPKLAKRTSWLDVFPTESVRLSCEMDGSSDWMFTWHRDGQKVHAGQGVSFDQDATVLSINSASASHRGQYSCSGKHKQRPVSSKITSGLQLDVYDTKPKVQLTQTHSYTLMYTEESVSFLCHINVSTGWEFVWYKDGSPITLSGNNLAISSVLLQNAGSYKCQARRGTSPTFSSDPSPTKTLSVEERPKAQILLLTGWSQAFSTDSLVLSCTVHESRYEWNYTWFKDGQEIGQAPSPNMKTYTVTPQDDPEQSVYSCRGTTNERPLNSTISDQFKTKNLLLKRRVLLSIAGCIVFGISAICLGCIFLRVFRKPAEEEYKPEEVDLFLRMDALKDSDDGPCPLVQYITESALNTSLKEEGENGTISSGTPLPETAQDETDATTESPDAVENHNGGLVSFQQ